MQCIVLYVNQEKNIQISSLNIDIRNKLYKQIKNSGLQNIKLQVLIRTNKLKILTNLNVVNQ